MATDALRKAIDTFRAHHETIKATATEVANRRLIGSPTVVIPKPTIPKENQP